MFLELFEHGGDTFWFLRYEVGLFGGIAIEMKEFDGGWAVRLFQVGINGQSIDEDQLPRPFGQGELIARSSLGDVGEPFPFRGRLLVTDDGQEVDAVQRIGISLRSTARSATSRGR